MKAARLAMAALIIGVPWRAVPAVAAERTGQAVQRVDGLKVCADGGLAVPGSNACVRLSGTLETDTVLRTSRQTTPTATGRAMTIHDHIRGQVAVDVRTPTELGPVRLYTSVRVNAVPDPDVLRR